MSRIVDLRRSSKHYLVYLITNKITGERYVGQHQTYNIDDGYMGSGRLLGLKLKEYGADNFHKEILGDFEDFDTMNQAEIDFIAKLNPEYNISLGGESFEGVNSVPGLNNKSGQYKKANCVHLHKLKNDSEYRDEFCKRVSNGMKKSPKVQARMVKLSAEVHERWKGRKHTEESKAKMSATKRGKQTTSTLGKHWFTNGEKNILTYQCPVGYYRGRV